MWLHHLWRATVRPTAMRSRSLDARRAKRLTLDQLENRCLLSRGVFIEDFSDDFDLDAPNFDSADADPSTIPGGDSDSDPNTTLGPDDFLFQHDPCCSDHDPFVRVAPGQFVFALRNEVFPGSNTVTFPSLAPTEQITLASVTFVAASGPSSATVEFFNIGTTTRSATVDVSLTSNHIFVASMTSNHMLDDGLPLGPITRLRIVTQNFVLLERIAVLVDEPRVNLPPRAADDRFNTPPGTPLFADVLANDSDPEGDPLVVTRVFQPLHGSSEIVGEGAGIRYAPDSGFVGLDSFDYEISDGRGGVETATVTVSVNTPPRAFDYDFALPHGSTGPLRVAAPGLLERFQDEESDPVTLSVATPPSHGTVTIRADGSFEYTPTTPGALVRPDSFTYRLHDGHAFGNVARVTISVPNSVPLASDDYYVTEHVTEARSIPAPGVLANDRDADGDALTAELVRGPAHGSVTLNPDGSYRYSPGARMLPDSFTYRVSDGYTQSAEATLRTLVTNRAPVTYNSEYSHFAGSVLTVAAPGLLDSTLATDFDNDPLTVVALTKLPSYGMVDLRDDGSFTYTPPSFVQATDTFGYVVSDGISRSRTATVTIHSHTGAPVARADNYVMNSVLDQLAGEVLANDWDPFDRPLTATIARLPSHGQLLFGASGSFVYSPDAGFTGIDSFQYIVSNGESQSAPAFVSIFVIDEPDTLEANPDTYQSLHDFPLEIPPAIGLLRNDSLRFGPTTIRLDSPPSYGTIDLPLPHDGSFVYRPNPGFVGVDTFSYAVSDNRVVSSAATVRLEIFDAAPVAQDDSFQLEPNTVLVGNVLDNDRDADDFRLAAELVSRPANGLVVLEPDGTFYYRPLDGFRGSDQFTYHVFDGAVQNNMATVRLGVNHPPVAVSDERTMRLIDQSFHPLFGHLIGERYLVSGPHVLENDSDPDGDLLTIGSWADGAEGRITEVFDDGSMRYERTVDFIGGLPGFSGADTVTYVLTDGLGVAAATVQLTLVPNNVPVARDDSYAVAQDSVLDVRLPVLGLIGGFAALPPSGGIGNTAGADSDADGDVLEVTRVTDPAFGTVNVQPDGRFTYTPNAGFVGVDSFQYQAFDGIDSSPAATVTIHVQSHTAQSAALERLQRASLEPLQIRFEQGIPRYMSTRLRLPNCRAEDDPVRQALGYLEQFRDLYQLADPRAQLFLDRITHNDRGWHVYFGQRQADIPVYGAQLAVHINDCEVMTTNGKYVPNLTESAPASLRAGDAEAIALAGHVAESTEIIGRSSLVYAQHGLNSDQSAETHLAWRVTVRGVRRSDGAGSSWMYLIDAHSGNVLSVLDRSQGDAAASARLPSRSRPRYEGPFMAGRSTIATETVAAISANLICRTGPSTSIQTAIARSIQPSRVCVPTRTEGTPLPTSCPATTSFASSCPTAGYKPRPWVPATPFPLPIAR